MAVTTVWTLEEAQSMVSEIKTAIKSIVNGTAQAYKIGSREYTALNLDELNSMLTYFGNVVESLSGSVRTNRVVRVVPRDL